MELPADFKIEKETINRKKEFLTKLAAAGLPGKTKMSSLEKLTFEQLKTRFIDSSPDLFIYSTPTALKLKNAAAKSTERVAEANLDDLSVVSSFDDYRSDSDEIDVVSVEPSNQEEDEEENIPFEILYEGVVEIITAVRLMQEEIKNLRLDLNHLRETRQVSKYNISFN